MTSVPEFDEFHLALHGYQPFPWQRRLAHLIDNGGGWPADIGVPTGLGKSTTVDIAVWHLARSITRDGPARSASTRIWYVVNRRLLVDAAYDRALRLQSELSVAADGPVKAVGDALRSAQAVPWSVGPLHVTRLRGGAAAGYRAPDPGCPTIVFSTVPMFGSRLLFRGYGSTTGMRPIDAALAGVDSLVLLDEAHLARPLQKLMSQLGEFPPPEVSVLPAARQSATLVNLTASGAESPDFEIDDEDRRHPIAQQRLSASKPTSLVAVAPKDVSDQLASSAVEVCQALTDVGVVPAVAVFVNTARRVPDVVSRLSKKLRSESIDADVVALTGRLREVDASAVRTALLGGDLDVAAGRESDLDRPVFVVATQTLEVGADLDFDGLVSETAGVRALVQRFGRLNRLGKRNHARATLVHSTGTADWPVYGAEPADVWDRLLEGLGFDNEDDVVDLGPSHITAVLGLPADPPPRSPELLPNHLRDWSKTSGRTLHWDPPVEPFVSGEDDDYATVTVIWRSRLPQRGAATHLQLRPLPHPDESVEAPLWEIRKFVGDDDVATVRSDNVIEFRSAADIRPGTTVLLDTTNGGYSAQNGGWDPAASEPVDDVSRDVRFASVLDGSLIAELIDSGALALAEIDAEVEEVIRVADLMQVAWSGDVWVQRGGDLDERDDDIVEWLRSNLRLRRVRGGPVVAEFDRPDGGRVDEPVIELGDELTTVSTLSESRAALPEHLSRVGGTAEEIARRIGLSSSLASAAGLAGRLHDSGKADARFQVWIGAPVNQPMAKSVPGSELQRQAWPSGARHEATSALLASEWFRQVGVPDGIDDELVLHLVLSHHGHGRPVLPLCDGGELPVTWEVEGTTVRVDADLGARDWEQPSRFERLCRRYGPWGLALLEAVVRQADHAESAAAAGELRNILEVR